jgi:hypothetical protein
MRRAEDIRAARREQNPMDDPVVARRPDLDSCSSI